MEACNCDKSISPRKARFNCVSHWISYGDKLVKNVISKVQLSVIKGSS